jgi:putative flavoprotein involved in K+ transport
MADGSFIAPDVIIAATGFSTDLDGMVGHLGILDDRGNPRGGFSSHIGDGMFAIGYGVPPNGPLRAIRLRARPLARDVARYLARAQPKSPQPLPVSSADSALTHVRWQP